MKFRPLTGQVLVQILPSEKSSAGGIVFPDELPLSPETVQKGHRHPTPPQPWIGVVCSVGPWPKLKCGLAQMPEFKVGSKVVIPHHAGVRMEKEIGGNYRMVRLDQVLGVLS